MGKRHITKGIRREAANVEILKAFGHQPVELDGFGRLRHGFVIPAPYCSWRKKIKMSEKVHFYITNMILFLIWNI
jgi:hypothetical protein